MIVLIHVANVLYLFSYLVKDILWLRLLTVVAGSVLLAYYVLLPVPLWAAIGWNVVFLAINVRQIHVLLLERRPVRLTPDELRLHQLAFRSLSQREFAKLLRIARWESIAADHRFVSKGQPLDRIMVIADGRACVEIAGATGVELRPGCFVGEMSFLTGQTPNADVVATEPTRLVTWPQSELKAFLRSDAELRAIVQMAIGEDLVAKLGYSRAS
jgi:Popeye protein conserved region